jgi:transposase
MARGSNKTQRVPDVQQGSLLTVPESPQQRTAVAGVLFDCGDRSRLFVGTVPLNDYLAREGLRWVLHLAKVMEEVDWKPFEAAYKAGGRPALHPRMVMGLIIYGLLLKQSSLRQLEALSRRDIGAWWIAGGLTPDHTTFTRFFQRHEQLLSEHFFIEVTSLVAKRLGIAAAEFALDGTVVQAMASTSQALKREALDKELKEAKEANASERVEKLEAASHELKQRETAKDAAGKDPSKVQVSPIEPEAVLQPQKNSEDYALAYKPVIGTHPSGLIAAQALSPSSETACVSELLIQHAQVFGAQPTSVLADAGFNTHDVLALFVMLEMDALVPGGGSDKLQRKGTKGRFPKSDFVHDQTNDTVRCPAGHQMRPYAPQRDRAGREYREFRTPECASCPLRLQCTTGSQRKLKRYAGDELKDGMAQVLQQPAARDAYARRAAMVEPAIARLRQNGLSRFTRRGRRGARLEFALRCVAHNLGLLLWGKAGLLVVVCFFRPHGSPWRLAALALVFTRP